MAAELEEFEFSPVLAGGNALGAYHLGASDALFGAGWEPDWLVGASIGAVTAAILAGNESGGAHSPCRLTFDTREAGGTHLRAAN